MLGMQPRILWCHARPGAGKSVLSVFLAQELRDAGEICAYFPFRYNNDVLRHPYNCLRSIAYQLAEYSHMLRLTLAAAATEFSELGSTNIGYLWQRLFCNGLFRVEGEECIYWILDAIDEGEPTEIAQFLSLLADIQHSATPIKLLIFSRYTKEIASRLVSLPMAVSEVLPADNRDDILRYTNGRLCQIWADLPPDQFEKVTHDIVVQANGTFLWVARALDAMADEYIVTDRLLVLKGSSDNMSDLYDRIMVYLSQLAVRQKSIVKLILAWSTYAVRPLTVEELAIVLKVSFGQLIDIGTTVRNLCGQLLTVDDRSRVQPNHMTVYEYLKSKAPAEFRMEEEKCNFDIATFCIAVLQDGWDQSPTSISINVLSAEEKSVIRRYCASFWFTHLSFTKCCTDTSILVTQMFKLGGAISWIQSLAEHQNLQDIQRVAIAMTETWLPQGDPLRLQAEKLLRLACRLGFLDYTYNGEKAEGLRQGRGVCLYSNGDKYQGEWWHDCREGQGRCVFASGDIYEGAWMNDEFHGYGKLECPDGSSYVGEWVNGRKTGQGTMQWSWTERHHYTGQFYQDRFHGKGKMIYLFGSKYDGTWTDGREHGPGRIEYWNGDGFEGQFEDGCEVGEIIRIGGSSIRSFEKTSENSASILYDSKARYHGEVNSDGIPDGQGQLIGNTGVTWTGPFHNGLPHGYGTARRPNGGCMMGPWANFVANGDFIEINDAPGEGKFVGNLEDAAREGYGELNSAYKYTYKGEFHRNEMHGTGSKFYENGDVYEGKFRDGRTEGQGIMRFRDCWEYNGLWQKDLRAGEGSLSLRGWGFFTGTWVNDQLRGPSELLVEEGVHSLNALP